MTISKETLQKIKKENLKPKPKWEVGLRSNGIWFLAILAALAGSVATAVMIHVALNKDWFIYHAAHHPAFTHFLLDLPFVWLVLFLATIWIAHYNVEHSKTGYHYSHYLIVLASFLFSLVFGVLFNVFGLGAAVDTYFIREFPNYKSIEKERNLWLDAKSGYLGGVITKIDKPTLELKDPGGKIWQVDISRSDIDLPCPLMTGTNVKIIGEETAKDQFEALEIHLWTSPGPRRIFIRDEIRISPPPIF